MHRLCLNRQMRLLYVVFNCYSLWPFSRITLFTVDRCTERAKFKKYRHTVSLLDAIHLSATHAGVLGDKGVVLTL